MEQLSEAQRATLDRLASGDVVMLQGRFWVWAKLPLCQAYPRPNAVSGSVFKILRERRYIEEIDPRRNTYIKRMYRITETGRLALEGR